MIPTETYLTQSRLDEAWYVLYDLKQATFIDTSDRMDLRKALDVIYKFKDDPRIPEEEVAA
jgi:hypothetical protein